MAIVDCRGCSQPPLRYRLVAYEIPRICTTDQELVQVPLHHSLPVVATVYFSTAYRITLYRFCRIDECDPLHVRL
jgi:hypothetical protein